MNFGEHWIRITSYNVCYTKLLRALDVARILAKTRAEFDGSDIVAHALELLEDSNLERIVILGRRGPHQIAMSYNFV